tara:strand:- start:16245 stop:16859 length:615 start_codon:yes stop_codon:yes gene_type:complete
MNISIIDSGLGNLNSIYKCIKSLDFNCSIVNNPEQLKISDKIIFPGVGSFEIAMKKIKEKGWLDELRVQIIEKKKFYFGICLGMQLLASKGHENSITTGLNFLDGEVVSLKSLKCKFGIPHIGWNDVKFLNDNSLFNNINQNTDFYFDHSYVFDLKDKSKIIGIADYGVKITSIINNENIYGVQFHPEKSSKAGVKLLENFLNL